MPGDTPEDAYKRGYDAGEQDARLKGHDVKFVEINGHIKALTEELHSLVLAVRQLGIEAEANAKTAVATAAALEARAKERREETEERWSPVQKGLALFGALYGMLTTAISIGLALYVAFHKP